MRCYHFCNAIYMSQIQVGIQSAHAQMELFVKYTKRSRQKRMLYDWGNNHKTMICLNGGPHGALLEIEEFMASNENPFPWSSFHEDEFSLNNAITNVAIILPEYVYEAASDLRALGEDRFREEYGHLTIPQWERELYTKLSRCGLA